MIFMLFFSSANAENNNHNTLTIYDLKKHGWKVVKQKSYIEVRSGISPYNNLKRRVQIVIHILKKGDEKYKCIIQYDSQTDTINEECKKILLWKIIEPIGFHYH